MINFYMYTDASGSKVFESRNVDLIICNTTNLNYSNTDEILIKGVDSMLCVKNKSELALGGLWTAAKYLSFSVTFKICENSTANNHSCSSMDVINTYLAANYMGVRVINSYFDYNDLYDPVKFFIDDTIYFPFMS